jgi:hypothetical protein
MKGIKLREGNFPNKLGINTLRMEILIEEFRKDFP